MSGWKKLASAAAASGGGLNVEEVFSTYLWEGTSTALDITNNIDFTGEGGMLWIKPRSVTSSHWLQDTERGAGKTLRTNVTDAELDLSSSQPDLHFSSDGFGVAAGTELNYNGQDMASWSFRKAPKFFDVVTWTGNGTYGRTISHNLGSDVGFIIIKRTDAAANWPVWHRGVSSGNTGYLDSTIDFRFSGFIFGVTSTGFDVGDSTLTNTNGGEYVAYVFAHNNSDGEFGLTGDQDIIKCGGWSNSGSATVNLGFEPQWIMIKPSSNSSANWAIYDVMRGQVVDGAAQELYPNKSNTEGSGGIFGTVSPTPTGFKVTSGYTADHIYIAIRRGPMAAPESATDVFAMDTFGGTSPNPPEFVSGFPVDLAMYKRTNGTENWNLHSRLIQGKRLRTNTTDAEGSETGAQFDYMNGYYDGTSVLSQYQGWMWKRAPNFCDIITYTGNGGSQTVDHNLGTTPNMIWIKRRDATEEWLVWHDGVHSTSGETDYLQLHNSNADTAFGVSYMNVGSTSLSFTGGYGPTNTSNGKYIAYLFATLAGVSKVGSYTGNGSTQTIDCGFSSGARFVLIKDYGQSGDWRVWDSDRGIVAGNDPFLRLNVSNAAVTTTDWIDPHNSGFTVNGTGGGPNESSANYIFYAIA